MTAITHKGGCHCEAVTFEVQASENIEAVSCTCSICTMTGFLHLIVGKGDLKITSGWDTLTEYRFNTGAAQHLFCKKCGVKPFYVPRSHPDGWSVNVNCLHKDTVASISTSEFDGANWEANISSLT